MQVSGVWWKLEVRLDGGKLQPAARGTDTNFLGFCVFVVFFFFTAISGAIRLLLSIQRNKD